MLNKLISLIKNSLKNLDKTALHILKRGLYFCFILCIISILILFVFRFITVNSLMSEIGFTLFRCSIIFSIEFIVCAFAADKIKKQII